MKSWLRKWYFRFPVAWRFRLRRLYYLPADALHTVTFRHNPMVPPRGKIVIGSGDYVKQGKLFLNYFIELGGLKPDMDVLDIGCGTGRMALPLTGYLTTGKYEGFDIMEQGVKWCQRTISSRFPNFSFRLLDIENSLYRPEGKESGEQIKFPYADNQFDFVFLTSVFTHMPLNEIAHYLAEINRVLKPGATCFFTTFLIDTAVQRQLREGKALMDFPFDHGDYFLHHENVEGANVALRKDVLLKLLGENNYDAPVVYPGRWNGLPNATDYQDIVVVAKRH